MDTNSLGRLLFRIACEFQQAELPITITIHEIAISVCEELVVKLYTATKLRLEKISAKELPFACKTLLVESMTRGAHTSIDNSFVAD
jgi:hypothetical protein